MKKYLLFGILLFLLSCQTTTQQTTDATVLKIKERGKLIVGSDIPYGVMEMYDESGNAVGIDIDIAREIATHLGVELEVQAISWDELFEAVKNGEVDIAMAAITITSERSAEMLFSIPYFNGGQSIIVREDNLDISGPLDLSEKKVGVQTESTSETEAIKYTNEDNIVSYLGYDFSLTDSGLIYDLKNNNIDAIIIDYVAAIDISNNENSLKIVGDPFTEEFYGIATAKENVVLMEEINAVLRDLKRTGKISQIIDNYS